VVLAVAAVSIPLVLLTLVGYYAALTAAALLAFGFLVARLLAGFYLGGLLRRWFRKGDKDPPHFGWTAGGILALHLLCLVPILGWLAVLGFSVAAFGALGERTVTSFRKA
jgi:hypothetical protein